MADYITQTDIENVFGSGNVATWSNLSGGTTADSTRIAEAIAYAEQTINDRFRGSRYTVPMTATSGTLYQVKAWAARLAGVWLYRARGMNDEGETDKLDALEERVLAEISDCLAGARGMAATPADSDQPTAPIVVQ